MTKPLVKICGLTRPADAVAAVELGADLIGLNFHPPSPRCVTAERAAEIAAAVRGRALLVGVFVALPAARMAEIDRAVGLDLLQFHGDQGPDELAPWGDRALAVTRVRREAPPAAAEIEARMAACADAWGFLFDVHHPDWGGSGESFGWELLAGLRRRRPLLVAGGIRPDNARRALAASGADGIDVASGVESSPGIKDLTLLERLMEEVKHGQSAKLA